MTKLYGTVTIPIEGVELDNLDEEKQSKVNQETKVYMVRNVTNETQNPGKQEPIDNKPLPTQIFQVKPIFNQRNNDDDDDDTGDQEPYDPVSRNAYVRKVMFITFVCFLITAGVLIVCYNTPIIYHALRQYNLIFLLVGAIGTIASSYLFSCSECSAKFPTNYMCLLIYMFFEIIFVVTISVRYKTHIIMYAFAATTVLVFVCLCIACTSFDFTKFIIFIVVISAVVAILAAMILFMMMVFNQKYRIVTLVIMVVVTITQSVMLILVLQMILGGKTVELAQSEHVYGAYLLYSSIMSIFLLLMQIFGDIF